MTQSVDKYNANTSTTNGWSTKVTPIAASKDADSNSKYLYLYTCEQRKRLDVTVEHTDILLDDSATIIDGGNIITGSINANAINPNTISGSSLTISKFSDANNYATTQQAQNYASTAINNAKLVKTTGDQ